MKKIFLITVIVVILVLGVFFSRKLDRSTEWSKALNEKATQSGFAYISMDQKALSDSGSNENQVAGALKRLSVLKEKRAFEEARKRLRSQSIVIRTSAIEALGNDDNPTSRSLILENLADPSEQIRISVLKAISLQKSKENLEVLQAHLKKISGDSAKESEKLFTLIALAQFAVPADEHRQVISEILKIASLKSSSSDTDERKSEILKLRKEALAAAGQFGPKEDIVLNTLIGLVENPEGSEITAVAVKQLAVAKPEALEKHLPKLAVDKSQECQIAVLQILPQTCANQRWEIIKSILKGIPREGVFDQALRTIELLNGPSAEKLVEEASVLRSLTEQQREIATAALARLKSNKRPEFCLNRKSAPHP